MTLFHAQPFSLKPTKNIILVWLTLHFPSSQMKQWFIFIQDFLYLLSTTYRFTPLLPEIKGEGTEKERSWDFFILDLQLLTLQVSQKRASDQARKHCFGPDLGRGLLRANNLSVLVRTEMSVSHLLLQSVSTWKVQQIFGLLACHSLIRGSRLENILWFSPWYKWRCWFLKIFEYNIYVGGLAYQAEIEMECGSWEVLMDLLMYIHISPHRG